MATETHAHATLQQHATREIKEFVEADSLGYLSLESLKNSVEDSKQRYCYACYTGDYPTLVQIEDVVLAKTGCC